ncbi:MAG TPA: prepilin-type N-terminal cleavage/methylation domain-containing protein [Bryobacteraceae bacterium]|nr:prepilin-type N-terminal cleavage/methylation domain-containing protein [Bryobacteraceae bacterium]
MKKNRRQFGFSLIELLIVITIIVIILTVAVPKLTKSRMYAQEMGALQAIRTLHVAETQYYSQYGKYATSLVELGPPTSGGAESPAAAGLIPEELALGEKQGYKYTLAGSTGGYVINASPVAFGNSGSRTFYSDQTMVVRQHYGQEPATASSEPVK